MTTLSFVNIHGQRVSVDAVKAAPKQRASGPDEFHKGWRVVGIPPGAWERAKANREADIRLATSAGSSKIPPELTYEFFANSFKGKPVRSKPYELREAADQCKELAIKAGWDRVFVVEMKRTKAAA